MNIILKYLAIIALFAISAIGVLGLNQSMVMEKDSQVSRCLFMIEDAGSCQMSISDHLTKWQGMFSAVLDSNLILMLFAFFSLGITYSIFRYFLVDPPNLYLYKLFKKRNSDLKLFDYLLQAISRGILHSRVYA